MYGHAYGDKALISLAENMQKFFPSSALLGRNGGTNSVFFYQIVQWKK